MEFKKIADKYFIRLDRQDEIISSLMNFVEKYNVKLGKFSAIGAVNELEIGLFQVKTKQYVSEVMKGDFEIISLTGNISTKNDQPYLHAHICVADIDHKCFGGHLNKAIVSATCEIIVEEYEGRIGRFYDDETGLNLLKLKD